jgi:hypothetical protein
MIKATLPFDGDDSISTLTEEAVPAIEGRGGN